METTSRYQDFTDESGSSIDSSEFRGHLCGPRSGFTDYSELPRCKLRQSLTTRSRKDDQEIQEAKIHRGARAYRAAKLWMRAPRPTEVSLLAIIVLVYYSPLQ